MRTKEAAFFSLFERLERKREKLFSVFIIDVIRLKRILKNSYCSAENNFVIRLLVPF